jgi:hypothetical protein
MLVSGLVTRETLLILARETSWLGRRAGDVMDLAAGSVIWLLSCWIVLRFSGSNLPSEISRRVRGRRAAPEASAE